MSEPHGGILGFLSEANEIRNELGVPFAQAMEVQRERQAERLRQYEAAELEPETNVLQFRPRGC